MKNKLKIMGLFSSFPKRIQLLNGFDKLIISD